MLTLPVEPLNRLKLADWLELYAILSPDRNSSNGDLERALRRAAYTEIDNDEAIERKTLDAFDELEQRVNGAKEAYPFSIDYRVLRLKSNWEDFPAYTFCLCLSYSVPEDLEPRKLFERLSCIAAKCYIQGNGIGFGSPRTQLPAQFREAIRKMCELIGEGGDFRDQPSLNAKDDTLDLVVWKDFTDKLPSKIFIFGQCASGKNWEAKLGELQPDAFLRQWMQVPFVSPSPTRSFFIPHRIEPRKWDFIARKAGVLFDRCRIAFWAHGREEDYGPYLDWSRNLLEQVVK